MKAKKKQITKLFKHVRIEIDKGYPGPACVFLDNMFRTKKGKKEKRPISKSELKWMKPGKNFDNNHFWKTIHETFGTLAITNVKDLSMEEANDITLKVAKDFKLLKKVEEKLEDGIKILEIGSGYGNFHNWLEGKGFNMDNYYSIDVYPYFFHDNLHITDGNIFPEKLPKFDIVYSCNVFQHLTQKQRSAILGMFLGDSSLRENDDKNTYKLRTCHAVSQNDYCKHNDIKLYRIKYNDNIEEKMSKIVKDNFL